MLCIYKKTAVSFSFLSPFSLPTLFSPNSLLSQPSAMAISVLQLSTMALQLSIHYALLLLLSAIQPPVLSMAIPTLLLSMVVPMAMGAHYGVSQRRPSAYYAQRKKPPTLSGDSNVYSPFSLFF